MGTRKRPSIRKRPSPRRLPKKLALIRKRLGLSQGDMVTALKLGKRYNRVSISGYERGEREPPLPVLLAYARFAGVTMEVLVDDQMKLPDK